MNNNDMDPFTKQDDPFTDTETSLKQIKKLINEDKPHRNRQKRKTKNTVKLFIPTFIFAIVWALIVIVNTMIALPYSEKNFRVELVSKKSYGTVELNDYSTDYTEIGFEIQNNSKYNIREITFRMELTDEKGDYIFGQTLFMDKGLLSDESKDVFITLRSNKKISAESYESLYHTDFDRLNAEFEISEIIFEDGKTITYPYNWFSRGLFGSSVGYFYKFFLIISIVFCIGWIIAGFFSRCSNCKNYFAVNGSGRERLDSRDASWVEDRAIKNEKGQVIGHIEETVYGKKVRYKNYYTCKYCGHTTTSTTSENVK